MLKSIRLKSKSLLLVALAMLALLLCACGGTTDVATTSDESVDSTGQQLLPPIPATISMNVKKGSGGSFLVGHDNILTTDDWDWNNNPLMPEHFFINHAICTGNGSSGFMSNGVGRTVTYCEEDASWEGNLLAALQSADMCTTCQVTLTAKYDSRPKADPKPLLSPFVTWTITAVTH